MYPNVQLKSKENSERKKGLSKLRKISFLLISNSRKIKVIVDGRWVLRLRKVQL